MAIGHLEQKIYVQATIGIIPCEQGYDMYADLLNDIEHILEIARGQNKPVVYDELVQKKLYDHLRLELSLKECVLNNMDGFSLNYQPIVNPTTRRWIGVEALCRWNSPHLGSVPPSVFIPEAEQLALIELLGLWTFEKAVAQMKQWKPDALDHFMLDVNLSPLQLHNMKLKDQLASVLEKYDFPANKASLEITESAEIHFDSYLTKLLQDLREMGFSLSLDGFGSGYSSFANLNKLPVDILKTDRSFVQNIESDLYLERTYHILVDFAHAADMQIIAESVETQEQMRILMRRNVDYLQGYLFVRPLAVEEMEPQLHNFWLPTQTTSA